MPKEEEDMVIMDVADCINCHVYVLCIKDRYFPVKKVSEWKYLKTLKCRNKHDKGF